jgi:hypothetical protein
MLVAGLLIAPFPEDPLQMKVNQIHEGMTKEQVVEIIGSLPTWTTAQLGSSSCETSHWSFGDAQIVVSFRDGRVEFSFRHPASRLSDKINLWMFRIWNEF